MPKKTSTQEMQAVLSLPGPQRYEYFVKQVADWEQAWGLFRDGWALAATNSEGRQVFPVWPSREYAKACAEGIWEGFEPAPISLEDMIEELLPKLQREGTPVGVFYRPDGKGVIRQPAELADDLRTESNRYE